jgi:hypothetical protein
MEIGRKQIRILHVSFQFQESTTIINDLLRSCNFRHSQYSQESAARYPGTAISGSVVPKSEARITCRTLRSIPC